MLGRGITDVDATVFRELLQISGMRGIDSTGIYLCDTTGKKLEICQRKEVCNSLDFVDKHGWHEHSTLYRTDFNLFMGHTRSKTYGASTLSNCHPFNLSRYVGAHNGTLSDWEFTYGTGGKTDSELMFMKMDDIGGKGPKKVLDDLSPHSAYAVTIFDKYTRKMMFARNRQRPLWVAINNKRPVIYWASEERFLDFVIDSNNLDADVFFFQPWTLYTIDIMNFKVGDHTPWTTENLVEQVIPPKKNSNIWYPPKEETKPVETTATVIQLNATTGESKEIEVKTNEEIGPGHNSQMALELQEDNPILKDLMISGVTDYFNKTEDKDDIDWSNVVNYQ